MIKRHEFKKAPQAELLRQLLICDFETGKLTWLPRLAEMFSDGYRSAQSKSNIWNARYAGKPAFTAKNSNGYFIGRIFNNGYLAHRVIWVLFTGEWPSQDIDHIDGKPSKNCIKNLREASKSQNGFNRGKNSNNTSGFKGVHWSKKNKKWVTHITINSHVKHIGYFDTPEMAHAAYCEAAAKHYGEFAHE